MTWINNDGGREAAGFTGDAGDCVTRAIAIATEKPYKEVYEALSNGVREYANDTKKWGAVAKNIRKSTLSARDGVHREIFQPYLESIGWRWVPTMKIGSGCQVHVKKEELPKGRIIVSLSRHLSAVIDGVVHDTHDPSRDGTRCVYGYFTKEDEN